MLKYGLFIGLMTLPLACSDHDDKDSPAPSPFATPTPAPAIPSGSPGPLTVPKLSPQTIPFAELPDTFGYSASFARIQLPASASADGTPRALVTKSRIQVRTENDRDILDCRFKEGNVLDVRYIRDGKTQSPTAFLWLNCMTLKSDLFPIQNIFELCDVYGCMGDTVNGHPTFKVKMEPALWIHRENGLRIKDGFQTEMLELTPEVPDEADFAYTAVD